MDNYLTIHAYGRYGEEFIITKIEEDKYLVSCYELDIDYDDINNNYLTKKQFELIHKRYIEDGEPNIDKSDRDRIISRASNMGQQLSRYYHQFEKYTSKNNTESLHLAILIAQLLRDVNVLELSDKQYIDWFLTHGSNETKEYIDLMQFLKEKIK